MYTSPDEDLIGSNQYGDGKPVFSKVGTACKAQQKTIVLRRRTNMKNESKQRNLKDINKLGPTGFSKTKME